MHRVALLATLALPACAADISSPPAMGGTCRPEGLDRFTGQPATAELGAELQRLSGARRLQWVGHGMMVTMDFSPERLRVFLTADNRVERASCG
jgi:hypothetical protein